MKEEACRNSIHCNNTEFLHRAFCIFCLCQVCCDINKGTTGINIRRANCNDYLEKKNVNTVAPVAMIHVCHGKLFFEGRREGTIQDFSIIHRYFSTNLNQMILYTVE